MSDTRFDRAPGDSPALAGTEGKTLSDAGIHTIGLALAVVLTAICSGVANTSLLWAPGVLLGLAVLAVAQMGVHLVFFLHITTGPDSTNNVLALALGVLIVILVAAGSIWIMADLNENIMPSPELMNSAFAALNGFGMTRHAPMITQHTQMHADAMLSGLGRSLADALAGARTPLLFGVRLWASVCLALFVAFWLQLDEPFWAATSAAVVCQPQLGASLRKGWFRMIGTVIGAVAIVVLTACFPQDRFAFFALLALWGGICAFVATVLRNFASYAAALAGYTAAIVAADTLGATGGASSEVFMLAIFRASEICIGIVCAGIVLAGTDLGGAQRRLAASFADLAADIVGGFTRMLALAGAANAGHASRAARTSAPRHRARPDDRPDARRIQSLALYRVDDVADLAVHGWLAALAGWRGVATHLRHSQDDVGQAGRGS